MGNDPGMIGKLKGDWEAFKGAKPGERFKERYHRRQQAPRHLVKRVVLVVLGSVIAVGSLFTAPLPGPGFATVFLGLAILGGELLPAARFLDWSEVVLRRLWQFVQDVWRTGLAGKAAMVLVATILVVGFLSSVYFLLFAR